MTVPTLLRRAPWLLALLVLVLGLAIWRPFPPGIWHDDGVYVLLGRTLAEGGGLHYGGVPGTPPAPKFPPLYPALLALVWLVAPDFPANVALLSGLNLVLTAAAAGLFVAWLRDDLGTPPALAAGVTILAWIAPALWRTAMVPLSEPLFLLCLVVALRAAARMERAPGPLGVAAFVLTVGAAMYARTLGVGILAGGVVGLLVLRRRRAALGAAAGGAALLLPWLAWSTRAGQAIPPALRDTLGPYGSWWGRQALADPGAFAAFLGHAAPQLVGRVLSLLLPAVTGTWLWAGLVLLPFLVLGLGEAGRRSPTVPPTLAISLGILWAWPFQEIRLLVPFGPLLLAATALGLHRAVREPRLRVPAAVLAGAWLAVLVPVSVVRLTNGWVDRPYRIRSEALVAAARAVTTDTPPDAVVGAPELWSGLHLLTGRQTVPSAPFHPLAGDAPVWGDPDEQIDLWLATGVTHVLLEDGGRVHGDAMDAIAAACGPHALRILERPPGPFLVELAWDGPCRERLRTSP